MKTITNLSGNTATGAGDDTLAEPSIKIEKVEGDYNDGEDEEDIDIGLEQGYICNPEPMNFTDSESDLEELVGLTTEQRKTKELCMNFGMEAAFKIFNEQEIYIRHLEVITPPVVLKLLEANMQLKDIIVFQHKLSKWQEHRIQLSKPIASSDSPAPSPAISSSKQLEQSKLENCPTLNSILKRSPESARLINSYQLSVRDRNILIDRVVKYFYFKRCPFTQQLRDNIANQIKEQFMDENKFFYSDDGLAHGGQDRFYTRLRYLTDSSKRKSLKSSAPADDADPLDVEEADDKPVVKKPIQRRKAYCVTAPPPRNFSKLPSVAQVPRDASPDSKSDDQDTSETVSPAVPEYPAESNESISNIQMGQIKSTTLAAPSPSTAIRSPVVIPASSAAAQHHPLHNRAPSDPLAALAQPPHRIVVVQRNEIARPSQPQPNPKPNVVYLPRTPLTRRVICTADGTRLTIVNGKPYKVIQRPTNLESTNDKPPGLSDKAMPMQKLRVVPLHRLSGAKPEIRPISVDKLQQNRIQMNPSTTHQLKVSPKPWRNYTPHTPQSQSVPMVSSAEKPPPRKIRLVAVNDKIEAVPVQDPPKAVANVPIVETGLAKKVQYFAVGEYEEIEVENTVENKEIEEPRNEKEAVKRPPSAEAQETPNVEEIIEKHLVVEGGGEEVEAEDACPMINFIKSDSFPRPNDKDIGSCKELNKTILSYAFEQDLKMPNRFREPEFCEKFVRKMEAVMCHVSLMNFDVSLYKGQPLSNRLGINLFLLPSVMGRQEMAVVRGKLTNHFVSVYTSVEDFVQEMGNSEGPRVAIIGKLLRPISFVVYNERKVYRCNELWHAIDMVVKIYVVYNKKVPVVAASAWQFVMVHFYDMEKHLMYVLPDVRRFRAMLSATAARTMPVGDKATAKKGILVKKLGEPRVLKKVEDDHEEK